MPPGFQLHHPGGMVGNSPAFQGRDGGEQAPSPAGTAEIGCVSRPSGTESATVTSSSSGIGLPVSRTILDTVLESTVIPQTRKPALVAAETLNTYKG